jgi:hypothetical protein
VKRFWMAATVLVMVLMGSAVGKAQAAPAAGGIDGKWQFTLDTPGGERHLDADFKVDADGKVTGTWGTSSVAGTYKDGKLTLAFQFTSDEAGETAEMDVDGTMDEKGVLSGKWKFSSYDGTFTASRPKQ